ncbi:RHS repeat-associated core domain-containing protein [Abyssisolibacter fermentans]|uniref:RHS repeat-associated core domain-containing protein n=1 Tax=Abyssisolibacter fermentans TaxID=1766203 RepID=UPI00082C3637|nr:RHS repeat-associated core domain-containing protein [Abyssisolibacter fermentans]
MKKWILLSISIIMLFSVLLVSMSNEVQATETLEQGTSQDNAIPIDLTQISSGKLTENRYIWCTADFNAGQTYSFCYEFTNWGNIKFFDSTNNQEFNVYEKRFDFIPKMSGKYYIQICGESRADWELSPASEGMTQGTATPIDLTLNSSGTFNENNYIWYTADFNAGQTYSLYYEHTSWGNIEFFDSNNNQEFYAYEKGFDFIPQKTGKYYIKINGEAGSNWELSPATEGMTQGTAIPIDLTESSNGTLIENGYIWCTADFIAGQIYSLHYEYDDWGNIEFYDDEKNREFDAYEKGFDFIPKKTGKYYIKFTGESGENWKIGPATEGMTKETAFQIDITADFEGIINETDVTWYKTELSSDQTYSFLFNSGDSVGLSFINSLDDEDCELYINSRQLKFEFIPKDTGIYYIEAHGQVGDEWKIIHTTALEYIENQIGSCLSIDICNTIDGEIGDEGYTWYSAELSADDIYSLYYQSSDSVDNKYEKRNGICFYNSELVFEFGLDSKHSASDLIPNITTSTTKYYIKAYGPIGCKWKLTSPEDGMTRSKALPIDLNNDCEGTITDVQCTWYATSLNKDQTYSFSYENDNWVTLDFYNSDNVKELSVNDNDKAFDFTPQKTGIYYIYAEGEPGSKWILKVASAGATKANSIRIDLTQAYEGSIMEQGYTWYNTELIAGKAYDLHYVNENYGGIEFYSDDNECEYNEYTNDREFEFIPKKTGIYYIKISGKIGSRWFFIHSGPDGKTIDNALPLDSIENCNGIISDQKYTWYSTELSADKTYSLYYEAQDYVDLYIYSGDEELEYSSRSDNDAFDFKPETTGTYYIKAEGNSGGKWNLRQAEEGMTQSLALPIDITKDFDGTITDANRTWYKTTLSKDEIYKLHFHNTYFNYISIYSSSQVKEYGYSQYSNNIALDFIPQTTGVYYIEVVNYSDDKAWSLSVATEGMTKSLAIPIDITQDYSGTITDAGQSWYKTSLNQGEVYSLHYNSRTCQLNIYSSDDKKLYSNLSQTAFDLIPEKTDIYYIEVIGNSMDEWTLISAEEGMTKSLAITIDIAQDYNGMFTDANQTWCKTTLNQGETYSLFTNGNISKLNIYNIYNEVVYSTDSNSIVFDLTPEMTGIYYIEVRGNSNENWMLTPVQEGMTESLAIPIDFTEDYSGKITPLGYTWYEAELDPNVVYDLFFIQSYENCKLCIYNNELQLQLEVNGYNGKEFHFTPNKVGKYYIRIDGVVESPWLLLILKEGMTKDLAIPLDLTKNSSGNITKAGFSWYESELIAGKTYSLRIENCRYIEIDNRRYDPNSTFDFTPGKTGKCYIKIDGVPEATWNINLADQGSTIPSAACIDFNEDFNGTFTNEYNYWCKTEVNANQTYKLHFMHSRNAEFEIYHNESLKDGNIIKLPEFEIFDSNKIFEWTPKESGVYYIRVNGHSGDTWSITPVKEGMTKEKAILFDNTQHFKASITKANIAWYKLELQEDYTYTFQSNLQLLKSLYGNIYYEDSEDEVSHFYLKDNGVFGELQEFEFTPQRKGTYYFEIHGYCGDKWWIKPNKIYSSSIVNNEYSGTNQSYYYFYGDKHSIGGDPPYDYVDTDVILGDDEEGFLSLPTDSFVTVSFDREIIDVPGPDIFIRGGLIEYENADIYVSSYDGEFKKIGNIYKRLRDYRHEPYEFDLASIDFDKPVISITIVCVQSNCVHFSVVNVAGMTYGEPVKYSAPCFYLPESMHTNIEYKPVPPVVKRIGYNYQKRSLYADPIYTAAGALIVSRDYLNLNGPTKRNLQLRYNSLLLNEGSMGKGWNHQHEICVTKDKENSVFINWSTNKRNIFIKKNDGTYFSPDEVTCHDKLIENADGTFKLECKDKTTYQFDESGKVTTQTDKHGRVIQYTYDENINKLTKVTEQETGQYIQFEYDGNNLLSNVTDNIGRTVSFSYDQNNNLVSIINERGESMQYTYDSNGRILAGIEEDVKLFENIYDDQGRVISQNDAVDENNITTFSYDTKTKPGKQITTVTNRNGETIKFIHNYKFKLIELIDELENSTKMKYDQYGNLIEEINALNQITKYEYDQFGNRVKVINNGGFETNMVYDEHNNLLSVTDALNQTTTYEYNELDNLTRVTYSDDTTENYSYDEHGYVQSYTDANGHTTQYEVVNGLVKSETDPNGDIIKYSYDAIGQLVKEASSIEETSMSYDALGNLTKVVDSLGNTTTYTYDMYGDILSKTDALGNTTNYEYNGNGDLIKVTDAIENVTNYEYDAESNLIKLIDAKGNETTYLYDELGRQVGIVDANGNTSQIQYDEVGNVIAQIDGKGNIVAKTSYDNLNRAIELEDALGNKVTKSYDAIDQVNSITNPLDQVMNLQYDTRQQLISVLDALGSESKQSYDANGQLTGYTDANGNKTTFSYDDAGHLISENIQGGGVIEYDYDLRGLLTNKQNARKQSTTYTYNETGRLIKHVDTEHEINYTYDNNGNLLIVTNEMQQKLQRQYDELNRVVKYTDESGYTISYKYDAVGNLIQLIYPDGKKVNYTYDAVGNMISVTDWNARKTEYEYDENNRLVKTTHSDGSSESRSYNINGQLITLKNIAANGETINEYVNEYDAVNNVIKEGNIQYSYDELERLTKASNLNIQSDTSLSSVINEIQYNYDIGGNITSVKNMLTENGAVKTQEKIMTYTADNKLEAWGNQEIIYDADGNMISGPLQGQMQQFEYDSQNRLTSTGDISYGYNAENIRTSLVNQKTGETIYYVVNPHSYYSQVLMETDDNGNVINYYVYGLGLLGQENVEGEYKTYHYDRRGSTVALTDETGKVVQCYSYLPYGKIITQDSDDYNPFLYNGKYGVITDDNELYYMRARYYNPDLRRFINRDVLAGSIDEGLSLNRYIYVNDNPICYIDPLGLCRNYDDFMEIAVNAWIDQWLHTFRTIIDLSPYGPYINATEVVEGKNIVTGEKMTTGERVKAGLSVFSNVAPKGLNYYSKIR